MRPYETTCQICHSTYTVTCTSFNCPRCGGKGRPGGSRGPFKPDLDFPF